MSAEKLVRMVNQIEKFFAHQPSEIAIEAIADHLRKFWDPRMRAQLLALGGTGLEPRARQAAERLRLQATSSGSAQTAKGQPPL